MSFSKQVKEELNLLQIKGNCCKKSYLLGVLLTADVHDEEISVKLSDSVTADKAAVLLKTLFKCEPDVKRVRRGCIENVELRFTSKKLLEFLSSADTFSEIDSSDYIFTCSNCRSSFLRGVFCALGSVSDPQKSYTLELRVPNPNRANLICSVINEWGMELPCKTARKEMIGLFYRKESSIEDFITACGANKALFSFFAVSVEKDFRNRENRATNCVARNISKSVEATALQISAIEALMATAFFDDLPAEVKKSALLRIENPDISLSELAELHVPPISKSGLNHRFARIIEEAKKRKLI